MLSVSGIQRAVSGGPKGRAAALEGGILRFSLAASLDMVWRVSASRSDGSQSGLSDLHIAPYTPV